MKRYDSYKDSGIEWIGEIPSHWDVKPLFSIASKNKEKNSNLTENNVLSLSYGNIVRRDISDNFGLLPDSFDTYQIVENGMLILRLTDLQNDKKSLRVGLVKERGIITSAYIGLVFDAINPTYAYYLLHDFDIQKVFYNFGSGVRQMMSFSDLKRLPIIKPNKEEQTAIANYLDQKTAQIDDLIAKKERLIQLLEEERTAIINELVTGKKVWNGHAWTEPAEVKDSGIEWLGEIPAHWEVKKLKFMANLKSGENITSENIKEQGDYPVYGGNGLRGYYSEYTNEGDYILIGRQGALCGNVKYVSNRFWASEHAIVCYLVSETNWLWFGKLLESMNLNQYNQSAAQPGLAVGVIKNLLIPVPNIDEQNKIVDFIDDFERKTKYIIQKTAQEIELLKEYKTALISEVVTGKLDVSTALNASVRDEKLN